MLVSANEYRRTITELASSVSEACEVEELIEQHEYVIYTAKALCVLVHSNNDKALFDVLGDTLEVKRATIYETMAYHAMVADVYACLNQWGHQE